MDEVDELFVCPASGDEGLAVGAALQANFELSLQDGHISSKTPLNDLYFGTSFSNEQIKWIVEDDDIKEFIGTLYQSKKELVSDEVAEFLKEIFD